MKTSAIHFLLSFVLLLSVLGEEPQNPRVLFTAEVRDAYGGAGKEHSIILRLENKGSKGVRLFLDKPTSVESYFEFVQLPIATEKPKSRLQAFITDLKTGKVDAFEIHGRRPSPTFNKDSSVFEKGSFWAFDIPFSAFGSPSFDPNSTIHFLLTQEEVNPVSWTTKPIPLVLPKK